MYARFSSATSRSTAHASLSRSAYGEASTPSVTLSEGGGGVPSRSICGRTPWSHTAPERASTRPLPTSTAVHVAERSRRPGSSSPSRATHRPSEWASRTDRWAASSEQNAEGAREALVVTGLACSADGGRGCALRRAAR
eukprot:scaffold44142_cov35-Tisochrysis_lutea.AAC.1